MSKDQREDDVHEPDSTSSHSGLFPPLEDAAFAGDSLFLHREQEQKHNSSIPQFGLSYDSYQPHPSFPATYNQPTPFPSQQEGHWLHPSFASSWSEYPNSLPSCLSEKDYSSCSGVSCHSRYKFLSLPGRHSGAASSLEQPLSLRSDPPSANLCHHTLSPYSCSPQGAACCAQCPADNFSRGHAANKHGWPQHHPDLSPYCKLQTNTREDASCRLVFMNLTNHCSEFCLCCFRSGRLQTPPRSIHTLVSCCFFLTITNHVVCFGY